MESKNKDIKNDQDEH